MSPRNGTDEEAIPWLASPVGDEEAGSGSGSSTTEGEEKDKVGVELTSVKVSSHAGDVPTAQKVSPPGGRRTSSAAKDVVFEHVVEKFKIHGEEERQRRTSMSAAAKNLKLDLNMWRGSNRPFDKGTRDVVMEILNRFDFDGDGQLEGVEVVKVCNMIKASNQEAPGGGIPIAAFPEKVRECVAGFDLDDSGYVEPIEVSCVFLGGGGGMLRRGLGVLLFLGFDLLTHVFSSSSSLSPKLVAGAQALIKIQKENRYMKIAIVVFICILVIFCFAIFGLTFAVVKMTEQTTPPSSESPEMYVKGTSEPIRVAATDTAINSVGPGAGTFRTRPVAETVIGEDGITRRLEVGGEQSPGAVIATDTVSSYAYLPDLLKMPLEVINSVQELTFMTFDGSIHAYPKMGVKMVAPTNDDGTIDGLNSKLVFYTSMAGIEVEVSHDRAYLLTDGGKVSTRIILPEQEDVDRRRLALLDHPDSDLHLRCHDTHDVCLHTLTEVMHIHGHLDEPDENGKRMLASTSSPGVAYAKISMDAFSINSNDGFVSWTDNKAGGGLRAPATPVVLEEDNIEYDRFGCLIEEGFETQAYPLTVKHCYGFRQTKNCEFTLGDSGFQGYESENLYPYIEKTPYYEEVNPLGTKTKEFITKDGFAECDEVIVGKTTGFCECGSGFKVKVGRCEDPAKPYSGANANSCEKVCQEHARATGQQTIDLYQALDQRLVHSVSLDSDMANTFFDNQKNDLNEYSANIKDSVYVATRFAYRQETPAHFGEESWPEWFNFHKHVRGHYTTGSLSADGKEWSDISGKNRHAKVTSGKLSKYTLQHPSGDMFDKDVVMGTTGTTVEFDSELFPPTFFPYETAANFKSCPACEDYSSEISYELGQHEDFTSFFDAGDTEGEPEWAPREEFLHRCQAKVAADESCGKYFDAHYPDFTDLARQFNEALDILFEGMLVSPPDGAGSFKEWEKCSDLGGSCECDGVVRFADETANSNNLLNDGFYFTDETHTAEEAQINDISHWRINQEFDGSMAFYYKPDAGKSTTCSVANLLPAGSGSYDAITDEDLSKWDCYCKSPSKVVDQARDELLGSTKFRYEFMWSDWSTFKPFEEISRPPYSKLSSEKSILELSSIETLVNPLFKAKSIGFGEHSKLDSLLRTVFYQTDYFTDGYDDPDDEVSSESFRGDYFSSEEAYGSDNGDFEGNRWLAAYDFCEAKEMKLCKYDDICPWGVSHPPEGGYVSSDSPEWVPFLNDQSWTPSQGSDPGSWAFAGRKNSKANYNTCIQEQQAEWGRLSSDSSHTTSYIKCCDAGNDRRLEEKLTQKAHVKTRRLAVNGVSPFNIHDGDTVTSVDDVRTILSAPQRTGKNGDVIVLNSFTYSLWKNEWRSSDIALIEVNNIDITIICEDLHSPSCKFDAAGNGRVMSVGAKQRSDNEGARTTADLKIISLRIQNGNANYGAAVYIDYGGQFTATSCQFINNQATHHGGAIWSRRLSKATVYGSYFVKNKVGANNNRGDIQLSTGATAEVHGCGNGYYGGTRGHKLDMDTTTGHSYTNCKSKFSSPSPILEDKELSGLRVSCRCKKDIEGAADIITSDEVKHIDNSTVSDNDSAIYTIDATDPKRKERAGIYWSLFHIARYAPGGTSKRIFENSKAKDGDWFDGFDDGKTGVANHHSDFVTSSEDKHGDAWVLSVSTEFSYRSNLKDQELSTKNAMSSRSLQGVNLVINPDYSDKKSDFHVSEIMVLNTPFPLTDDQKEDMERILYMKQIPLFIRGHYTTDSFVENLDGKTDTWDDLSFHKRNAQLERSGTLEVVDSNVVGGGMVLNVNEGETVTFPMDLLPDTDFTVFSISEVASEEEVGPAFEVTNDSDLQDCFDKEAENGANWQISGCAEGLGDVITITATEQDLPLLLCEVEVLKADGSNLAKNQPTNQKSIFQGLDSILATDGSIDSCASTKIHSNPNTPATWSIQLHKGSKFEKIRITTGGAANSATYTVAVNDVVIGQTLRELPKTESSTYNYLVEDAEQTFFYSKDAFKPSLFIQMSEEMASKGAGYFLEICEVEVFGELSVFEEGSLHNPNLAVGMPATITATEYGMSSAVNDGDRSSCVKTIPNQLGVIRLDLVPGVLPTKVNIIGRTSSTDASGEEYLCKDQHLGLQGVTVSVGTLKEEGGFQVIPFLTAINTVCEAESYTISSALDVEDVQLKIGMSNEQKKTWFHWDENQSGDQADQFCKSKGPEYRLCNYVEICPGGQNVAPYGGTQGSPVTGAEGPQWTAYGDGINWVQVGQNALSCRKSLNPSWGRTVHPVRRENIMCCSDEAKVDVCEVEVFVDDGSGGEKLLDLKGAHSFFGSNANQVKSAAEVFDGEAKCKSSVLGDEGANDVSCRWKDSSHKKPVSAGPSKVECHDGSVVALDVHFGKDCNGKGGRARCPDEKPYLSENRVCAGGLDHCCETLEEVNTKRFGGWKSCVNAGSVNVEAVTNLGEKSNHVCAKGTDCAINRLAGAKDRSWCQVNADGTVRAWYVDRYGACPTRQGQWEKDGRVSTACCGSRCATCKAMDLDPFSGYYHIDGTHKYSDSEEFCENKGKRMCSYQEYCPNGFQQEPEGGQFTGDIWAPFKNDLSARHGKKAYVAGYKTVYEMVEMERREVIRVEKVRTAAAQYKNRGCRRWRWKYNPTTYQSYTQTYRYGCGKGRTCTGRRRRTKVKRWGHWKRQYYTAPGCGARYVSKAAQYKYVDIMGMVPYLKKVSRQEAITKYKHDWTGKYTTNQWVQVGTRHAACRKHSDETRPHMTLPSWGEQSSASQHWKQVIKCCSDETDVSAGNIFVNLGHREKVKRVVVHTVGNPDAHMSATLTNGVSLGDFGSVTSETATLGVSVDAQDSQTDKYNHLLSKSVSTSAGDGCGVGGSTRIAKAPFFANPQKVNNPCDCQKLCEDFAHCLYWNWDRSASSVDYKTCSLSAFYKNTLEAIDSFLMVSGGTTKTNGAVTLGKQLTLTGRKDFEVASLLVLDGNLPPVLKERIAFTLQNQFVYLLYEGLDVELPFPKISVTSGFVMEGGGTTWATSPKPMTWQHEDDGEALITDELRTELGLSDHAHSLSGEDTYLISDYLAGKCVAETSKTGRTNVWGFDPVTTEGWLAGRKVPSDSFGVEIETLSICRRMTTTAKALADLLPSTICGLDALNDENPTCQPTKFIAKWAGDGISFEWLPGCRAAEKYQIVRGEGRSERW